MALYAIGDLHLCLGAPKPMDIFGSAPYPKPLYLVQTFVLFRVFHSFFKDFVDIL